ncbi:hypothetical protein MMC22_010896 [Lobaria immixta]|nr:hypothetical protein [Lobaria immixta]
MTRAGAGSSTRPLLAPVEAPGDGHVSLNSFEKKEYSDTESERQRLLDESDSDGSDDARSQGPYQTFEVFGDESRYAPVEQYEGRHRYDPKFEWKPKEEKKLVRKLDIRICSWVCFMFLALQLDRSNIYQALSDNMLGDLGMNTNDYNTGQAIFYVFFLTAELPSQLISKKLGPERWVPVQMVSWSVVASCQAFLTGRTSFFACRALLGMLEGGFIPDNILYLSYFYTGSELPIRLGFFWVSSQATNIISAFLAFGLLRLRGVYGLAGWRWLFGLEGWFRGKDGWFNEREERIMVNRIIRDDPSKGDMHNREALSLRSLWLSLTDYDMWPIYLLGLSWLIPSYPMTQYLTLHLRSLEYTTFETNLLTIPAYVLFIIQILWWTWVSGKTDQRFLVGVVSQVWALPILIVLENLSESTAPWIKWGLSTLMVGHPYIHAILVAITSRNAGSVRTRTVASALYNMCVQASNVIGSNIYRDEDKPLYRAGNKVLIVICCYNICLFIGAKVFYVSKNSSRQKIWDSMSTQEKQTYLKTTTDQGNKR